MKRSCGCHTGALFALGAIILCVTQPPVTTLPGKILVVFAAAIIGKMIGIIGARILFPQTEG